MAYDSKKAQFITAKENMAAGRKAWWPEREVAGHVASAGPVTESDD